MIVIFFFSERKCVDLVVISNTGRDDAFTVSLLFVYIKYWTLGQPLKSIVVIFTMFLYSKQNAQNFSIDKNLFILQFFGQINFSLCLFLIEKIVVSSVISSRLIISCLCLRHGAYLNGIFNVFACLLSWPFFRTRFVWVFLK